MHTITVYSFLKASYLPHTDRPHLNVLCNALVHRIIMPSTGKSSEGTKLRATGVEFEYEGKVYTVKVKRDVILSAGYSYFFIYYVMCAQPTHINFHSSEVTTNSGAFGDRESPNPQTTWDRTTDRPTWRRRKHARAYDMCHYTR